MRITVTKKEDVIKEYNDLVKELEEVTARLDDLFSFKKMSDKGVEPSIFVSETSEEYDLLSNKIMKIEKRMLEIMGEIQHMPRLK